MNAIPVPEIRILVVDDHTLFRRGLTALLSGQDGFKVVADAADYGRAQNAVDQLWCDQESWSRAAITNTMACGFFSSDRAISEYAERIWRLEPIRVEG